MLEWQRRCCWSIHVLEEGTEKTNHPSKNHSFLCRSGEDCFPLKIMILSDFFLIILLYLSCASPRELCKSKRSSPLHVRGCECGQAPPTPRGTQAWWDMGKGLRKVIFKRMVKSGVYQAW